ncbi:uncharacterized protein LOC124812060 [Hydra vulgaris]|uniref:uncharacterized protein LOC124812060 n=1 Tax=Hydra vulgaris TaxID=6087 RepID=UPI0032EA8B90
MGRHLGLSGSDLDHTDSDNKNCYEKADNVLKKWKQKNGGLSWKQLKKELKGFDRSDIVREIEKKLGGYGVFTIREFKAGDPLLEYKGNLITRKEAKELSKSYSAKNKGCFIFDVTGTIKI